jgi:hypothetical protein
MSIGGPALTLDCATAAEFVRTSVLHQGCFLIKVGRHAVLKCWQFQYKGGEMAFFGKTGGTP